MNISYQNCVHLITVSKLHSFQSKVTFLPWKTAGAFLLGLCILCRLPTRMDRSAIVIRELLLPRARYYIGMVVIATKRIIRTRSPRRSVVDLSVASSTVVNSSTLGIPACFSILVLQMLCFGTELLFPNLLSSPLTTSILSRCVTDVVLNV